MTILYAILIAPFADFEFMRRALAGCLALSVSAPPVGVFLMLRRMSLMSDAMSHAILPGAAAGFLVAGLSLPAMTFGGLVAGLAVALLAGAVTRTTALREDASLAAFYLISLAGGVLLVSLRGSQIDLMHFLFGSVLALDDPALLLLGGMAFATFLAEGAVLGWSAIALNSLQHVDVARAGSAYALFAVTMTAGRFAGDRWVGRHGGATVLLVGSAVAVAGLLLALWSNSPGPALLGYAIAGIGAANIAPLAFSAAGRQPGASPQVAVAAVSAMGYSGSLAGPALIGFVAHASSLPLALTLVAAGLALAVILASGSVRAGDRP